jgi:hypothetical protein
MFSNKMIKAVICCLLTGLFRLDAHAAALDLYLPNDSSIVLGINSDYKSDIKINIWKGLHFQFVQSIGASYHFWSSSVGYFHNWRFLQEDFNIGTEGSYEQGPFSYWTFLGISSSWGKFDFHIQYAFSYGLNNFHSQPLLALSYPIVSGIVMITEYSTRYQYLTNMEVLNFGLQLFSGRLSTKVFGQFNMPIILKKTVQSTTMKIVVEYALL